MDINVITGVITSVGFPIAACCYLAWDRTHMMKEFNEKLSENTRVIESLKQLISDLHREGKGV